MEESDSRACPASRTVSVTAPECTVIAIWHDIDHNGGANVHEWFVPEGTLTFDRRTFRGRDQIAEVYRARRDGTSRVARHVATNLQVEGIDDATVKVVSTLVLFAGNGDPPLREVVPQLVADVQDVFVRTRDCWLIQARRISHVFISEDTVLGVPTS